MDRSASLGHLHHKGASNEYTALPSSESYHDLQKPYGSDAGGGIRGHQLDKLPGRAHGYRAKGKARMMKWLVVYASGSRQTLSLDKRQLIQHFNLDIPVRDMRLLDTSTLGAATVFGGPPPGGGPPGASQAGPQGGPAAAPGGSGQLLVRDNAMVLSMEHVKMIITADKAIISVPEERSETHDAFVAALEAALADRLVDGYGGSQGGTAMAYGGGAGGGPFAHHHVHFGGGGMTGSPSMSSIAYMGFGPGGVAGAGAGKPMAGSAGAGGGGGGTGGGGGGTGGVVRHALCPVVMDGGGADGGDGSYTPRGPLSQQGTGEELAFELHCLEAGLGEVCRHLAREVEMLQATATPALEDLVASSDRRNLERVRRVKTLHQRLITRVTVVRDTLHKLMEDDADMFRMCLSRATQRRSSTSNQLLIPTIPSPTPHTSWTSVPHLRPPTVPVQAPAAAPAPAGAPPSRPLSGIHSAFASQAAQTVRGGSQSPPDGAAAGAQGGDSGGAGGAGGGAGAGAAGGASLAIPSPQHRTSGASGELPLDPGSLYAFGSASLRSASMLAMKFRHMQQMAAAAAAVEASRQGGTDAMPSPGGPLTALSPPAPPALLDEDDLHDVLPCPALPCSPRWPPDRPVPPAPPALLDEDDLHDVLDVENLLEAYAQMADVTHASLVGIGEYIEDTEDLVSAHLDYSRNKLIRFELLITMGTFALAFYACVAGILGENLVLPESITQDISGFVLVNGLLFLISVAIFLCLVQLIRNKGLMARW